MKRIAIIGGGIVGSTVAYYLSKEKNILITLYDDGNGQATKAAVGIVCPWVSQRRNKVWYQLACDGADFYKKLINDLGDTSFYTQTGTLIQHDTRLESLTVLAQSRLKLSPMMKSVSVLSGTSLREKISREINVKEALFVEGGAQVDGGELVNSLQKHAEKITIKNKAVTYTRTPQGFCVDDEIFDCVICACGAWLPSVLKEYEVDIKPQKGQLIETKVKLPGAKNQPVIMPQGEIDILTKGDGTLIIGATHENNQGYDLRATKEAETYLIESSQKFIPAIDEHWVSTIRVGIRAQSSDNTPFYGLLEKGLYVASGLGSSGLTTGPIIGYRIAQSVLGESVPSIDPKIYVKKRSK